MTKLAMENSLSKIDFTQDIESLVGTFCVKIDPTLAELWLQRNNSNRNPNREHIRRLAQSMGDGRWKRNGQSIIFGSNGDLLDGQHRLMAVVESGATIESDVTFGIDPDAMVTLDEGKKRTAADLLSIKGFKNYSAVAAAAKYVMRYNQGMIDNGGNRASNPTNAEILDWVNDNPGIMRDVETTTTWYSASMDSPISNAQAASYLHICSKIDREMAEDFLFGVVTGAGLDIYDPEYILRRTLLKVKNDKGVTITQTRKTSLVAMAWRVKREGRPVKFLRVKAGKKVFFK